MYYKGSTYLVSFWLFSLATCEKHDSLKKFVVFVLQLSHLLCEFLIKKYILYDCRKQLISPNTTKKRERKWIRMTSGNNWDTEMIKNFKRVIFHWKWLFFKHQTINIKFCVLFYRYKIDVEKEYRNQSGQGLGCTWLKRINWKKITKMFILRCAIKQEIGNGLRI